MKQIFSGEVYEILPISNGIIFSYCKEIVDENVIVAYKMISFDNNRFTDVAKNIYMITKFGNNYKAVSSYCANYITAKSLVLPNGKVFLLEPDGSAALIDNNGTPVWTGSLVYRSSAPSDIILHNGALWACYPDCNVLLRYNLSTMREELRIGGNKSPFDKPRNLFIIGDNVTVSNQGSKKLVEVNLNSYTVSEGEEFEEALYQYVNVCNNRFVLLESGLYLI